METHNAVNFMRHLSGKNNTRAELRFLSTMRVRDDILFVQTVRVKPSKLEIKCYKVDECQHVRSTQG